MQKSQLSPASTLVGLLLSALLCFGRPRSNRTLGEVVTDLPKPGLSAENFNQRINIGNTTQIWYTEKGKAVYEQNDNWSNGTDSENDTWDLLETDQEKTDISKQNFNLSDKIDSECNKSIEKLTKDVNQNEDYLLTGVVPSFSRKRNKFNFLNIIQWLDQIIYSSDRHGPEYVFGYNYGKFNGNDTNSSPSNINDSAVFEKGKKEEEIFTNETNLQQLLERKGLDSYTPPIILKETPETGLFEGLPIRRFDGTVEGSIERESSDYIYVDSNHSTKTPTSVTDSDAAHSPTNHIYIHGDSSYPSVSHQDKGHITSRFNSIDDKLGENHPPMVSIKTEISLDSALVSTITESYEDTSSVDSEMVSYKTEFSTTMSSSTVESFGDTSSVYNDMVSKTDSSEKAPISSITWEYDTETSTLNRSIVSI